MEPHDVRRGRIAYEAYAVSTGGKTYDGREMPSWGELPEKIRAAWIAASMVLWEEFMGMCCNPRQCFGVP